MSDNEEKVKVKFLLHCMQHKPGDEVDVSKVEAESLCMWRSQNNGQNKITKFRVAMTLKEYLEIKSRPIDKGGMTQDELEAMGERNVVETPIDKTFEKRLEKIKNGTLGEDDLHHDEASPRKRGRPKQETLQNVSM